MARGRRERKALAWAKQQNARTLPELEARPEYRLTYQKTLEILDSREKIPVPELHGTTVYNFWKDEQHERGIWRRTSLDSYRTAAPDWETVIDVDALAKAENVPWDFKGADCLPPDFRRCLVSLSRGGADAVVVREFDTIAKAFVSGGFTLPEAKSRVAWRDADTIWVGTDFGPGSLTTSGYPRVVKLWQRGTPLADATRIFAGPTRTSPPRASAFTPPTSATTSWSAFRSFSASRHSCASAGDWCAWISPTTPSSPGFSGTRFSSRCAPTGPSRDRPTRRECCWPATWTVSCRGKPALQVLFEPTERISLAGVSSTRDRVLVLSLDNVQAADWHRSRVRWQDVDA
jgi:prolyl oligopeptidase